MNHLPRILIIDDNQAIHRDFSLALAEDLTNPELEASEALVFGTGAKPRALRPVYELEHALNGLEGVEKVRQSVQQDSPFQLAFVDIRMPGIDGVETVERIWRLDAEIQVVFCTAYADYSWEDLACRLGHTDKALVLKKPFDHLEVIQMASTLTEKWRLARQAAMKLEQMELLVSHRTQKYLELQRREFERLRETDPKGELPVAPLAAVDGGGEGGDKEFPMVLVVGSDRNLLRTLKESVEPECRIRTVAKGTDGFDSAREWVPDLVVAETVLPGMDGFELCRRLKADELACHIPVMLVSGAAGAEDVAGRALEVGAEDCLTLPVSVPVFRARIQRWLSHGMPEAEAAGSPPEMVTNRVDADFLRRTTEIVEARMSDFEFDVEALAQRLHMSRRQLLRKLKGVAGCSPNAFVRALRLKRAAQLLRSSGMTVSEITYAVGFADLKHFRSVFREQYGVSPAEYGRGGGADSPS
jgi:CheY-like chemotaxis protein/AraC-like DNA-binding protein